MTIGSTIPARVSFNCDGVTKVFPIPIQAYQATDITVVLTLPASAGGAEIVLTLNSDYSMAATGTLNPQQWTLTTLAANAYVSGYTLQAFINPVQAQQTSYVQGQAFPSLAVQTNLDRLTQMVQRLQDQVNRSMRAPDGDVAPSMTLPPATSRALTYPAFDANGNAIVVPALPGSTLTPASLGAVLYPINADETNAGVVPINLLYPYGYVDRYGNNTTPGTTDMAPAFNNAIKVANQLGCKVRWGLTAPYALNTAVNCTNQHGLIFEDESSGAASSSATCSIIAGNNGGHTFDLTASYECTFNNLAVNTKAGTAPLTLFFCARNPAGSGAGLHRFNNVRTASTCTFKCIGYQYGSEENTWLNCMLQNVQPGAALLSWNSTNPQLWTSPFTTVATGSQSNVEHKAIGCSFYNFGNSGSQNELCIQLENAGNVKVSSGLFHCAHGLAYVENVGTQACIWLSFRDMRGEIAGGGQQPLYGYVIANSAGTNSQWTIDNCQADSVNELVHFNTGVTMQNLNIRNGCSATSGKVLSAYNLSDSVIETLQSGSVTGQVGGNVTNNLFIGARTNVVLSGAFSSNLYSDVLGNGFGVDNDSFTSANAACTGALTTPVQYTVRMSPNGKMVTLALPATQGTTTAAASFTYGVVLPVQYRPSANLRQAVIMEDNGATLNQMGQVFINAATGAIIVLKDIVGTATFTNGGVGGLPGLTEVSWNL